MVREKRREEKRALSSFCLFLFVCFCFVCFCFVLCYLFCLFCQSHQPPSRSFVVVCVLCFLYCVRVCSSPHTPSAPFSLSPHLLTHRGERRRENEPLSLSLMKGDEKQRMRKEVVCVSLSSSPFFSNTLLFSHTPDRFFPFLSLSLSLFLSPLSFLSSLSFTQFSGEQNIKVGEKGWCFVSPT